MPFHKLIRQHLLSVACLMAVCLLSVYVVKAVHTWQVEEAIAGNDQSHNASHCDLCHFSLAAATPPSTIVWMPCEQRAELACILPAAQLVAATVHASLSRGPPALVF